MKNVVSSIATSPLFQTFEKFLYVAYLHDKHLNRTTRAR